MKELYHIDADAKMACINPEVVVIYFAAMLDILSQKGLVTFDELESLYSRHQAELNKRVSAALAETN